MLTETSLLAYENLKLSNKIGERQLLVLQAIKTVPRLTAFEYAKLILKYEDPNKVRPRITELKKLGIISKVGVRNCQISHNKSSVWEVKNEIKF